MLPKANFCYTLKSYKKIIRFSSGCEMWNTRTTLDSKGIDCVIFDSSVYEKITLNKYSVSEM